jgi:hypothetical protein
MYEPTSQSTDGKSFFSALLVFHQGLLLVGYSTYSTGGADFYSGQNTSWPEQGVEMHASAGDHAGENNGHRFLENQCHDSGNACKHSELVRTPFQLPNGIAPCHSGDGGVRLAWLERGNLHAPLVGGR